METTPYWMHSAMMPQFAALDRDVEVDVAIVGGGLTGITAAYLLKKAGAKVALFERNRCACADTGHTTAHLTFVTDLRLHEVVKRFNKDCARAFWDAGAAAIDQIYEIMRHEEIDCEFRWVPGYLHAALKQPASDDRELLQKDAALAGELGFGAEFLEAVPLVNRPGVRFANQAKFHPRKYLAGLLARVAGNGSYVFENSEVTGFEEPAAVQVGPHRVHCRYVIIATHNPLVGKSGTMSATLFQSKLALYTSYVLGARLPHGVAPEALFWDTDDPYYYLRVDRHEDGDYAIFGGEDVKTGQEKDPQRVFARLEEMLRNLFPMAQVEHRWLGQVVETNDGLPFIGETAPRQFVATGFCGNGFTLGTLSAMMARDRFLDRPNPWFDLFDVGRKKLIGGTWRYLRENVDYPFHMLRDRLRHVETASLDEIKRNEGRIVYHDGRKVAAFRDARGELTLLSPVCTHLKCIVAWNDADKTWDCPCHGSRFKATGEVHSGPAEKPLEKISHREPRLDPVTD